MITWTVMYHPEAGSTLVPNTALKHYKAKGWTKDKKNAPAVESQAASNDDPNTTKNTSKD